MVRAFQVLAVLSAFFVVAVRCLGAFPLLVANADSPLTGRSVEARSSSGVPVDPGSMAISEADDDADDGAEAFIAPAAVRLVALAPAAAAGLVGGARAHERALPSHAPSLDRPPRA
jgi:hypothetical protein